MTPAQAQQMMALAAAGGGYALDPTQVQSTALEEAKKREAELTTKAVARGQELKKLLDELQAELKAKAAWQPPPPPGTPLSSERPGASGERQGASAPATPRGGEGARQQKKNYDFDKPPGRKQRWVEGTIQDGCPNHRVDEFSSWQRKER